MGCGAASQHQRVCIDVSMRPAAVTPSTVNVWLDITFSTESINWGFDDNQTMTSWGQAGDAVWNFHMSAPSATSARVVVASTSILVPLTYAGPQTYGFGAQISGQYLGGTPSHVEYFNVPARPPSVPGAPGISVGQITQDSAYVTVTAPSSNGGAGIDAYTTEVWYSGASSRVTSWAGGSGTASGLIPGTSYAARAAAHNAAGWGPWSVWREFVTVAGGRTKVAGTWRTAGAYVKVAGTWRRAAGVWKKRSGVWVK